MKQNTPKIDLKSFPPSSQALQGSKRKTRNLVSEPRSQKKKTDNSDLRNTTLSKGERTRLHILEKSITCFSKKGFENASLTELAQLADVNRALIIHYFSSIESLISECFQYVAIQVKTFLENEMKLLETETSKNPPYGEHIFHYAHVNFDWLKRHPSYAGFIMSCLQRSAYHKDMQVQLKPLMRAAWERIYQALKNDFYRAQSKQSEISEINVDPKHHSFYSASQMRKLALAIHTEMIGSMLFYHSGMISEIKQAEEICVESIRRILNTKGKIS